ncbi:MAG: hypothetical protein Q4E53_13265 [Eubacteriales bacterium]|nr:hypothetical protein [Eubacteriales bacterium]
MTACGMFEDPAFDVLKGGFKASWTGLREAWSGKCIAKTCANCSKQKFCLVCAASANAETGSTDGVSPYHCAMADAFMAEVEKNFGQK